LTDRDRLSTRGLRSEFLTPRRRFILASVSPAPAVFAGPGPCFSRPRYFSRALRLFCRARPRYFARPCRFSWALKQLTSLYKRAVLPPPLPDPLPDLLSENFNRVLTGSLLDPSYLSAKSSRSLRTACIFQPSPHRIPTGSLGTACIFQPSPHRIPTGSLGTACIFQPSPHRIPTGSLGTVFIF
jgi:hypothetical protein